MAGDGLTSISWEYWRGTPGGAALLIIAWVFFTTEMVLVRQLSTDLSIPQITFFRLASQFVALAPIIILSRGRVLATQRRKTHFLRACCSATAMPIYYLAFALLPFALATTLTFTQAFFLVVLAALIGKERVLTLRWLATASGFVGVLVVMRPGFVGFETAMLLPLVGSLVAAYLMLLTRQLGKTESWLTIMCYVGVFGPILMLGPAVWTWQPITVEHLPFLAMIGITGTFGQFLFVRAFQMAEASALAPIDYVRLIFAVIAGNLVFSELPDIWTWIGAAIIIVSAVTVTHRERRLG